MLVHLYCIVSLNPPSQMFLQDIQRESTDTLGGLKAASYRKFPSALLEADV